MNDLTGALVYDQLGAPSVTNGVLNVVGSSEFDLPMNQVPPFSSSGGNPSLGTIGSTGGNPFTYIDLNATLAVGQKYWIVLNSAFNDANNYYYWYYNPNFTAAGPWASTTNAGATWTVQQSPGGPFCFQVIVSAGVLAAAQDQTSMGTYGNQLYENAVSSLGQTVGSNAQQVAQAYGQQLLGSNTQNYGLAKKKRFLRLHTIVPDTPIYPGQSVNVTCSSMQLDTIPFNAVQIQYDVKDVSCFDMQVWLQRFQYL